MDTVCGILNHGNTCYINAGLQCLASCPGMLALARRVVTTRPPSVSHAVAHTLLLLRGPSDRQSVVDIRGLLSILQPRFRQRLQEQSDAQEFVLQLLDIMHREDVPNPTLCGVPFTATSVAQLEAAMRALSEPHSEVASLFYGQCVSQVRCLKCAHVTHTPESFAVLNLVPPRLPCSWDECLTHYFAPERIEGYACGACKCTAVAEKTLRLWRIPECLMIGCRIPPGGLTIDLSPCVVPSAPALSMGTTYHLTAMTCHEAHHYYAVCRDRAGNWFTCNDAHVSPHAEGRPCTLFFCRAGNA